MELIRDFDTIKENIMKVALAIPTYNAGNEFEKVVQLIYEQSKFLDEICIVDSQSIDNTVKIAQKYSLNVEIIDKNNFSHSGTRSKIAQKYYEKKFEFLIFMTQDVFLQENAISELLTFIRSNPNLGVVRGKQEVDLTKGDIFEYHARQRNYGNKAYVYKKVDIPEKGIDTIYTSDAFAIYNLSILNEVGYFGENAKVSEDMLVAHNIIQEGYSIGYAPKAKVFHTHHYTICEEYARYKIIGEFHNEYKDILEKYGNTQSKGISLAANELLYLFSKGKPYLIPYSVIRNISKLIGFKVGYRSFRT